MIEVVMSYQECISSAKDIVVAGSAIFASVLAFRGLNTWQRELKGKSEYALAKSVLLSAYKVREAFKHIRHPAIYQYEYPEEMTDHRGHLVQEHKYEGTVHVYTERWKKMDEAFRELEEKFIEALVEWGSEYQDEIIDLRKCRAELMIAIQQLLEGKKGSDPLQWMNVEERARQSAVIYQSGGGLDTFTPEIEAAIKKFDDWLRPHITR